jgi:hypothetical protein
MPRRHAPRRQHRPAERKRERKNRVLPLDHLQSDLQIVQPAHSLIVKQWLVISG